MADLQRTVYPHKWSPVSCRSSAGQRKFAGQRPTFYHCATQWPGNTPNNNNNNQWYAVSSHWKICRRMCVSINGPGDLDPPFAFEIGMRVASKVGNLHSEFGHTRPWGSRVIRYVRDGRTDGLTDGLTDGQTHRLLSPSYGRTGREYNK